MENLKINHQLKDELFLKSNELFADFEKKIAQEISDTKGGNSWVDCLTTRVTAIQNVFMPRDEINRKTFFDITGKISNGPFGSSEIQKLKDKYPDDPPEDKKRELIEKLKEHISQIINDNF